jgi:hypothetical protein
MLVAQRALPLLACLLGACASGPTRKPVQLHFDFPTPAEIAPSARILGSTPRLDPGYQRYSGYPSVVALNDGTVRAATGSYSHLDVRPDGSVRLFERGLWPYLYLSGPDDDVYAFEEILGADTKLKGFRLLALRGDGSTHWQVEHTQDAAMSSSPRARILVLVFPSYGQPFVDARGEGGKSVWTQPVPGVMRWLSPTHDGGVVVSGQQKVLALRDGGEVAWTHRLTDEVAQRPAIGADGTVYLVTRDGKLRAIDARGEQRWAFATGGTRVGEPAIAADGTIYVTAGDGHLSSLIAVSPEGARQWTVPGPSTHDSFLQIGADGTIYGHDRGRLMAVRADGVVKWVLDAGTGRLIDPVVLMPDGRLYAAAGPPAWCELVEIDTGVRGDGHPTWASNYRPGLGGKLGPKPDVEGFALRARVDACLPAELPKARLSCEESCAARVNGTRCVFGQRDCSAKAKGSSDETICANHYRQCLLEEGIEPDTFEKSVTDCQRSKAEVACRAR